MLALVLDTLLVRSHYPNKSSVGEEEFITASRLRDSVYHVVAGVGGCWSHCIRSQEAGRNEHWELVTSSFCSPGPSHPWTGANHSRIGPPTSVNSTWTIPHRHDQRLVSSVVLDSITLTTLIIIPFNPK